MARYDIRLASDGLEEPDAVSSIGQSSSPQPSRSDDDTDNDNDGHDNMSIRDIFDQNFDDEDADSVYEPEEGQSARRPYDARRRSDEEKARMVLDYLRDEFKGRFSLRKLLDTLFRSQHGAITITTGKFLADGGAVSIMGLWWASEGTRSEEMSSWVVDRAAEVCAHECSRLTDTASKGQHFNIAKTLRISPKDVTAHLVDSFSIQELGERYTKATPHLQTFLQLLIGAKPDSASTIKRHRDSDHGRTTVTSMLLNLRSRRVNYHTAINALVLWDNKVPKRAVQMLNRLGFCSSHTFQIRAVEELGKDVVRVARVVGRDPMKIKQLVYDNFNWRSRAWEVSASHGVVQHDQVSAILVVLQTSRDQNAPTAAHLTSVERFRASSGKRHQISEDQSLEDIVPSAGDHHVFRENAILHVAHILSEDLKQFHGFRASLPKFTDPKAIPLCKTERYYLPTFDQEQGSTRGNMIVLRHYFLEVLCVPKSVFEHIMYFVLGDRLTTARDRAAQDQRAVDRSDYAIDHLSSLEVSSGLMHVCMNIMQDFGRNSWGSADSKDDISLSTLRDLLPNRTNVNMQKHDYYGWLRFLDVILRALVVTSAMSWTQIIEPSQFNTLNLSRDSFMLLCANMVDSHILPSPDRLEADGVKTLEGETVCGHAVLTAHDLMTLREMRHAIKYGHPTRISRILRYWTPMFYAGRGYNYSHELMELMHNETHDWPRDSADVIIAGMLVNPSGEDGNFLEGDLDCEHLNEKIKGRTHEPNITPATLAKITPALGHARHLTDRLYQEVGAEAVNQHHAHVRQTKDVEILVAHFKKANVFNFAHDSTSKHTVTDLYRHGLFRLAGPSGGHAKHLARHKLRLRTRHGNSNDTFPSHASFLDEEEALDAEDRTELPFTLDDDGEAEEEFSLDNVY
ncbi:hypothetical protein HWV62_28926 [Athelia sp. TMB]|nr:hypothetical protein HWV62_28926 [Athelia sp. TMB]